MALSASLLGSLAALATTMRMPALAAVALPVTVEVFAAKAGMTVEAMIAELRGNEPLRDYAAQICIKGAEGIAQ